LEMQAFQSACRENKRWRPSQVNDERSAYGHTVSP
jgi:hypothetical protein